MNSVKLKEVFSIVAIVLIAIISISFIFVSEPEDSVAVSSDGVVTVTGEWLEQQPISITSTNPLRYSIGPEFTHVDEPYTITFDLVSAGAQGYLLYWWNADIDMWEPVEVDTQTNDEIVFSVTTRLGGFGLFPQTEIEVPDFVSKYDELLAMAPLNAVGYEIAVGVVGDDGFVLRVKQKDEIGGCSGVIGHGNVHERSELDHSVRVLVDDVETLVEFRFVGEWVVDEYGCGEGAILEPVL
ncbi:hypothetical protein HON52_04875 [Candidatus Uhrbacteria bacterium]|jgi:hypothetical protein|nr:hypothetical protein [Candidatus Uhrbacteria bacterium]